MLRMATARVCFRFDEEMRSCARQFNLPVPNDRQVGYDFGYGSLNETEEMCRYVATLNTIFTMLEYACLEACAFILIDNNQIVFNIFHGQLKHNSVVLSI